VGIVTQPDRPVGRKKTITAPPIKKFLVEKGFLIKIFQPEKIKLEAENILMELNPEIILVASYGQILPDSLINFSKYGCLNFHGSLLPELRGAVPIQMALLNGLSITGVTIQKMVKDLDAGAIISQESISIEQKDDYFTLENKLSDLSSEMLGKVFTPWVQGKIKPSEQDALKATFCFIKDASNGCAEIVFETKVDQAERIVRAFLKSPVAWVSLENGKILKIFRSSISSRSMNNKNNNMKLLRSKTELFLVLENGLLNLEEVQLEGKKRLLAKDYLYLGTEYID
jgi:methionyl-tRNA formyltransferase